MLRRLFPVCLTLALWGCNASPPPVPAGGTATPGGSAGIREAALDSRKGNNSKAAGKGDTENGTTLARNGGTDLTDEDATDEAEPKSAKSDDAGKKPPAADVDAVLRKLNRARTPEMFKSGAEALEKALEDEPDHVEGLLTVVQVYQYLAHKPGDGEPTEPMIHKSVAWLDRTIKAHSELLNDPKFKSFAAAVYVSDARALAREKKPAESMAALKGASEFEAANLDELEKYEDLAAVRELPEFPAFVAETKERIKKEVTELLEANKPFDFDFSLDDIAGNKLSKADLAGRVLIVDIWGTWCPPCRMEIPHFVALDKEYREKGLQIVGLNQERGEDDAENLKMIKEFCEENGVTYPCALITEDVMNQVPDFEGFPTTLFLDHTGKVRLKAVGLHDLSFLRAAVETLLKEKGAAGTDTPAEKTGG